ncbi:short-chain dehydrogenase/reductase [Actinocatenispora thailandica]|uniref:Short-chain dehydrogenase/reductase n=1 Tax=Actinocatenispora thailandica TaxID=227318 RepID=A0A7R7I138_9ACTN|nr:SDR family NAD(P)-dependent oxidoreductase [Actinocatenispora thailandica]BCJ39261.1 short-chain dehydrogenase/reductase [Actinocatenispora thailandica]
MSATPPRPTVLVTGAATGIGRATARLFAERGARVFGTSRQARPADAGVEMLVLDVRSARSVRDCVDAVVTRCGQLDVLVNNAGASCEGFAEETSPAAAEAVFDTNFFGAVRVTHAVLPGMRARRRGRIVNVGSLAGWIGEPGEGFYAASKAALARYTEALRHEVWHLGISVSLVEPAAFRTEFLREPGDAAGTIADYDGPRESARRTLHESLRRGGDPRAVAELISAVVAARKPRGRYGVGRGSFWVPRARTLLPQRLFDDLLRRGYRLPR